MDCAHVDAWLDAMLDDVLTDEEARALEAHCADCEACARKLRATRAMREMFSDMAPEEDVPLKAQAAWRSAVKREAGRIRTRRLMRWAGGIAAALVVAMGGIFALRGAPNVREEAMMDRSVKLIEADGVHPAAEEPEIMEDAEAEAPMLAQSARMMNAEAPMMAEESIDAAVSRPLPMHEWTMTVEDLDRACAYMADLVNEYAGELDEQRCDDDGAPCANLFIEMPAENTADFLSAAAHYDLSGSLADAAATESEAGRTSLLLVLKTGG